MEWPKLITVLFVYLLLLLQKYDFSKGAKTKCGFPGTPAYGYVKPDADIYQEGETVFYSCRVGYILLGSPISRCREDGTWSEEIPICDDSMTTLGIAFSTAAIPGHPAELAIDKDKNTCTYLAPKKPRWWRIDLGGAHKVLSVAVTMISTDKFVKFTVFVIKIQGSNASYKRCASFTGKFGTSTIVLTCAEGKGIEGQKVHIEDHQQTEGFFEICEVEVQVEKDDGYDCGRPDRKPFSLTYEPEDGKVEYTCITGYELEGESIRACMVTGHWSGTSPFCEAIVCHELIPLENGEQRISILDDEIPLEGAVVTYQCDEGYRLEGDFTRICLKDGSWSGNPPTCEAIRCPVPDARELGGVYRLVNKTTRMGSMALLKCRKGKIEGKEPYIICTEDGTWSKSQAHCLLPARASLAKKELPIIVNRGAIIFGMVAAGIMITVVLISFYIVAKRRRQANKPELPSRQLEPLVAPPRPPPRSKGIGPSFRDFMNKDSFDGKLPWRSDPKAQESTWKTQSLPLEHGEGRNHDTEPGVPPPKTLSLEDTLHSMLEQVRAQDNAEAETSQSEHVAEAEAAAESKEHANEEEGETKAEDTEQPEDSTSDKLKTENENEDTSKLKKKSTSGEYAAVDYEKKRQSRLLKGQDSGSRPNSPDEQSDQQSQSSPNTEDSAPIVPPKENLEETEKKAKRPRWRAVVANEPESSPEILKDTEKADVSPKTEVSDTLASQKTSDETSEQPNQTENKEDKSDTSATEDAGRRRRRRQQTAADDTTTATSRARARDAKR